MQMNVAMRNFSFARWLMVIVIIQFARSSGVMACGHIEPADTTTQWVLVIHGGAGGPPKGSMEPAEERAYLDKLSEALEVGRAILAGGGRSIDAVEAVVRYMEDCPLFNAGRGAVLNGEGKAELDASIMDGATGKAGAVSGVTTIRHPVTAARRVMDSTKHVMLTATGAERFAAHAGLEMVENSWFITPERKAAWEKWQQHPRGTVGAVALDVRGNLASATSTGGMMGKMPGRVGDTPVIGAGTYASNQTCAVSATGHGEFFIRRVVAFDVSARMAYRAQDLKKATDGIIMEELKQMQVSGGLIAVDRKGNIAMPFNTNAMFRGYIRSDGSRETMIY